MIYPSIHATFQRCLWLCKARQHLCLLFTYYHNHNHNPFWLNLDSEWKHSMLVLLYDVVTYIIINCRVISRAPGLKLVVETLLSSLRPIGNIVLICLTFFLIFGILGVQVCVALCRHIPVLSSELLLHALARRCWSYMLLPNAVENIC